MIEEAFVTPTVHQTLFYKPFKSFSYWTAVICRRVDTGVELESEALASNIMTTQSIVVLVSGTCQWLPF